MPTAVRWRGAVVPLLLVLVAEIGLRGAQSDSLAPPSEVFRALLAALGDGTLLAASAQTLAAALGGLAIGGSLGLLTGMWLGASARAAGGSVLLVELLRPIPSVALIPVALLTFGFGYRLEIFVVAFTCFFPLLLLTQSAVRGLEPRLIEVSQVLGLSAAQRAWSILLPATVPSVFVAFRLGLGIALVVAVTTEIASNPQGLGYGLLSAQQSLQPALMLATLVWVGFVGWAANAGLLALERRWFGSHAASGAAP